MNKMFFRSHYIRNNDVISKFKEKELLSKKDQIQEREDILNKNHDISFKFSSEVEFFIKIVNYKTDLNIQSIMFIVLVRSNLTSICLHNVFKGYITRKRS